MLVRCPPWSYSPDKWSTRLFQRWDDYKPKFIIKRFQPTQQVQISYEMFWTWIFCDHFMLSPCPCSMLFYLLSSIGKDWLEDWRERRLADYEGLFREEESDASWYNVESLNTLKNLMIVKPSSKGKNYIWNINNNGQIKYNFNYWNTFLKIFDSLKKNCAFSLKWDKFPPLKSSLYYPD